MKPDRRARADEIRNAALARARLGQGALHQLADGRHVVTLHGRRFSGDTLDQAIEAAARGEAAQ